ncbi:MAG: hypothetical protein ACK5PP_18245 [Acidimicrobiales bacterium]
MAQTQQMHLIYLDDEHWRLDANTIRVGRQGLAAARRALAAASPVPEVSSPTRFAAHLAAAA